MLLNPSNEELTRLGISISAYKKNDFFIAKIGGICRWSTLFSIYYFFSMTFGVVAACGFVYGASLEGEREAVFEIIHFIPLVINMGSQAASYHLNQEEYLNVFRGSERVLTISHMASLFPILTGLGRKWIHITRDQRKIDKGVFDYAGTLDEETKLVIADIKAKSNYRKQKFGIFYTTLLTCAHLSQVFKRPLNYIMRGRGIRMVDGENNLIWEAPFGMYMPYADMWGPYLAGELFGWSCANFTSITCVGCALTYQYICEELLAEFAAIEKTMGRCVQRAERLCLLRRAEGNSAHEVSMDVVLRSCINFSIKHHHQALMMFDVVKKLMFMPLFSAIFDTGLVLCISCYLLISDDVSTNLKLSMPPVILAEAGLVFMYCYYGEKLSKANEDIGNSIYNCEKWADQIVTVKPYALIIKVCCNKPKQLSAGGFSAVNHRAFSNILSTAYSYMGFMLSK